MHETTRDRLELEIEPQVVAAVGEIAIAGLQGKRLDPEVRLSQIRRTIDMAREEGWGAEELQTYIEGAQHPY